MKESAVADGGENRRRPVVLRVGMVEARCHGDRRAHVVNGVDRALVEAQGVAADVAGEDGFWKRPPQRIEDRPVSAAGAEGRATNGQFQAGDGLLHAIGGALDGCEPGLAGGGHQQSFNDAGRQFAVAGNMPREATPDRYRQPDLQFDRGIGFLKDDESLAAQGKIVDQGARQRVDRGDLEHRQLLRQPEGLQHVVQIGVADARRHDAQRRTLRLRSGREEGVVSRPGLELLFNRRQFLVQLLVQCHPGARRCRPAPGVLDEVRAT